MDTARGAYVRSPHFVRRALVPLVSRLPTKFKFGPSYRLWRQRIDRAAMPTRFMPANKTLPPCARCWPRPMPAAPFIAT